MAETKPHFPEHITPELITPAWRMTVLNLVWDAGFMIAAEGRLYFIWKNTKTRKWDILFEADKQDVKVEWPWHYFGGGVRLTIDSKVYTIFFARPNGAENPDLSDLASNIVSLDNIPLPIHALAEATLAVLLPLKAYGVYRDLKKARSNTKAWREYLET